MVCPQLLILILRSELLAESLPGALQLPILRIQMNEDSIAPHHPPQKKKKVRLTLMSRNSILRTYCVLVPVERGCRGRREGRA